MAQPPELYQTLSVSQITGHIQHTLEQDYSSVWVKGEISNLTRHSSGHWYFTLKDQGAQLSSVMFRQQNQSIRFEITHGMEITVHGRISIYPPQGRYQLIVDQMQASGQGDLHLAFDALKKKLHGEGLFDPGGKQMLPKYPERIGIITSPTGAAIRDMINVIIRRFPLAKILLFPVRVQGEGSANEIARAIKILNEQKSCDVLIAGRGGGSLEDLWAFNEEIVARAIANSSIPIVSAVGHETDTTISDYIADKRAPTPSAAAELVVPEQSELKQRLNDMNHTLHNKIHDRVTRYEQKILAIQNSYALKRPMLLLEQHQQRLDYLQNMAVRVTLENIKLSQSRLNGMEQQVEALSPLAILERGYAVISQADGRTIHSAENLSPGQNLHIRMSDGEMDATIDKIKLKK